MNDPIKLDWQPASTTPTTDDLPVVTWYPNSREMGVAHYTVKGLEGFQWARLRIAPPEEKEEAEKARPADEWLNRLPEWLKKRAIANIEEQSILDGHSPPCLWAAFGWQETPEGSTFWSRVHDWFECRKPLPPNPDAKVEDEGTEDEGAQARDPLADTPVILAVREAMIAASNAPSADAARRWFSDRYLEVMEDKQ